MRRHRGRQRMVEPELLARFEPMARLRADERIVLASQARIIRLPAGRYLFRPGQEDRRTYFLLAGRLRLTSHTGEGLLVESGGANSRQALSLGTYEQYKAVTLTATEVVGMDSGLVAGISSLSGMVAPSRFDVACDAGLQDWMRGLFEDVRDAIEDDQLVLPVPPAFGEQIANLMANERIEVARLIEAVCADPAICAKLLRVANGALFHDQPPVLGCKEAIDRIGVRAARNLVMNYAIRDRLRNPEEHISRRLDEYWLTATSVAAVSAVLASRLPGHTASRCRLAGLLHDIGTLVLLAFVHQFPSALLDPSALDEAIDGLSLPLGDLLVQSWGLGDDLLPALLGGGDWYREHHGETDIADLILVARAHSRIDSARGAGHLPDPKAMPAYERLGLGTTGQDEGLSILVQAQESIEAAQGFLSD